MIQHFIQFVFLKYHLQPGYPFIHVSQSNHLDPRKGNYLYGLFIPERDGTYPFELGNDQRISSFRKLFILSRVFSL